MTKKRFALVVQLSFAIGCEAYSENRYAIGTADGLPIKDVVTVSCLPIEAPAGATVTCTATIPEGAAIELRGLEFRTTAGVFVADEPKDSIKVEASAEGTATALLTHTKPEVAKVTAKVVDVTSAPAKVTFTEAPAPGALHRAVSLSTDAFGIQATALDEVDVAVVVEAEDETVPKVGSEVVICFYQAGDVKHVEGRVRDQTQSDAQGRVSAKITAGETSYRGPLTISACPAVRGNCPSSKTTSELCAETTLTVVEPLAD